VQHGSGNVQLNHYYYAGRASPSATGSAWSARQHPHEFVGRRELLSRIADTARSAVTVLHGMGGIGKSSIAVEYARLHSDAFDIVWWVPSEDPAQIPQKLAELARTLTLAGPTDSVGTAVARLMGALTRRDGWLLIFDNAESPNDLTPFLPTGPGQVLVTSRNPSWPGRATLPVSRFDRDESVELLVGRAPQLSESDADRISHVLGDLPLAVEQAAAYIAGSDLGADAYIRELAHRPDQLLTRVGDGDYPTAMTLSWTMAFDRLAIDDPVAFDVMTLLAWMAPEPVPIGLLRDQPDALPGRLRVLAEDDLVRADCVRILHKRSMVAWIENTLQLHRVPAALLRARNAHAGEAEDLAGAVLQLLRSALPDDVWDNPDAWGPWEPLLPHVLTATDAGRPLQGSPAESGWLLDRAASYLHTRGDPRAALPLFRRAFDLRRDSFGDDHQDTLKSASHLAVVLDDVGDLDQARALHEKTLLRRGRTLGSDHVDTLSSANNFAAVLRGLGRFDVARAWDEDTFTRRRRVLGEDHEDTLGSAGNLAADLHELGEYEKARTIAADTHQRTRRVLGDDHPHTIKIASNLAHYLHALGEHREAHDLNADTLERYRRVLGADHPDTLRTANNLALDLYAIDEREKARELMADTFERYRSTLGDDHPTTLSAAINLGQLHYELREHARWRELTDSTLGRLRRSLGRDHPTTLMSAGNFAASLHELGEHDEARAVCEDTLERYRRTLGNDHPHTRRTARNLDVIRRATGGAS
jgi:tetratricopeptide (TPR) repeat protein